jgi:hypothetical protein
LTYRHVSPLHFAFSPFPDSSFQFPGPFRGFRSGPWPWHAGCLSCRDHNTDGVFLTERCYCTLRARNLTETEIDENSEKHLLPARQEKREGDWIQILSENLGRFPSPYPAVYENFQQN